MPDARRTGGLACKIGKENAHEHTRLPHFFPATVSMREAELRVGESENLPVGLFCRSWQRQPAIDFDDIAGMAARLLQAVAPVAETAFAGDPQSAAGNAVGSAPLRCCRKIEKGEA